jgi:DNA repair protein RadC
MKHASRIVPKVSKPAPIKQPKTTPRKLPEDWEERYISKEFKVISLRDLPITKELRRCDTPELAAEYWRLNIPSNPYFNSECECMAVLILNTRRHVKGHQIVTVGTLDALLVHAREVFRAAIVASAAAIILMHNHPSGDATPSEADITVTRKMARAGAVLGIQVLDHLIVTGQNPACPRGFCSLRELGYLEAA